MKLGLRLLLCALPIAIACGSDDVEPGGAPPSPSPDGGTAPARAEFGLDARPANATCKAPARPPASAPVRFERVFAQANLGTVTQIAQMPGDPTRWFVAHRGFDNEAPTTISTFSVANPGAPLVDVATTGNVGGLFGEGGLLGMAFHPGCTAASCRLYISWTPYRATGAGLASEIGYFTSTDGGQSFGGYTTVLGPFVQPYNNHNGGALAFGKDGYLYASFGDGGSGYDPEGNGQKRSTFFSKILRIDVDDVPAGATYGIPDGNPFKNGGGEPATFAWGFRNPFRFSVDRETNEVWVGDVGQDRWEEIDKVVAGGNYGWPCREGMHDYPYPVDGRGNALTPARCPSRENLADPVMEHEHQTYGTRSITGGVVYRGKAIPQMVGTYVYGDFENQDLFALSFDPTSGSAVSTKLNEDGPAAGWVFFAEDLEGEIYALTLGGEIYAMKAAPGGQASTFPDRLSKTGCVDAADPRRPAAGLVPYGVNAQLWSDGAEKQRWLALPDGATITVGADGDFAFPKGTVLMKSFAREGKPLETRLFIHHDDDTWGGYSYEWLDDGSDAVLLPSSKQKDGWYFPSRSDCVRCHTDAAGRSLGLEIGQLNGDFVYPSTNRIANQLTTFQHIGLFAAPLGKPAAELAVLPPPSGSAPVEARARAYLHANCANCHRPGGGGRESIDLRFGTSLADTKTCNVDPAAGNLEIDGAKLLVPGDPARSLLAARPRATGIGRMPPVASSVVDAEGTALLDSWINSIAACP